MRAAQFNRFGGPEVLEIVDLPDPHPGPGEVRIVVRAAGVNAGDQKKRQGLMDPDLPQTLGYEAAGLVDEIGDDVDGVEIGDAVFGFAPSGAAQAELAVLAAFAKVPAELDLATAASLPSALETAARALDAVGVGDGTVVLINGASGNVGAAAAQLAVARGARVIGVASSASARMLEGFGVEPVAYGEGMPDRVRLLAPSGIDAAIDVAGNGILPELIALVGGPGRVVTLADVDGARDTGVRFSRGDSGRALYVLDAIGDLVSTGEFVLPAVRAFPLDEIRAAHRFGEQAGSHTKIVVTADRPIAPSVAN